MNNKCVKSINHSVYSSQSTAMVATLWGFSSAKFTHQNGNKLKVYISPKLWPIILNACTKFNSNPCNNCWDFSLKAKKCQPASGAGRKETVSQKSEEFILWGPRMSVQNFMAYNIIVVEIFQSGPKWWTNWPTNRAAWQCSSLDCKCNTSGI